MMEERGLGTKATRADIIQKLYYRGYVHGNPPEPSETGVKMYEGFKTYVPRVADSEMTAQLEAEMDQIAQGEMTKDDVLTDSRDALRSAYDEMGTDVDVEDDDAPWRKFARLVWSGMDEDRILGPCVVCQEAGRTKEDGSPNMLRVIRAKKSGKSFIGCTGWDGENPDSPDSCDQTFPMPQPRFYDVHKLEEICTVCGRTPRVSVAQKFKPGRPWKLCFNDDCPSMEEMKRKRAEREAAKAAKEAAKEAEEAAAGNGRRRRPIPRRPSPRPRRSPPTAPSQAAKKAAKKKAATRPTAKAAAESDSDE